MTTDRLLELAGGGLTTDLADEPLLFHLQLASPDGPPSVVLNTVAIGHARGASRVVRLLRQAGAADQAAAWPLDTGRDGTPAEGAAVLAECDGLFNSNVNLRAPVTRYEVEFPYTTSGRAAQLRIPLRDLHVAHDPVTGTLHLVRHGDRRRIRLLHSGLMAEFFLPSPLRHLVELYGPAPTLVYGSMPMFLPSDADPRSDGVHELPRLEVGPIVLGRRSWAFPAREMPTRAKGEADTGYWLRLAAWMERQGMPERFFARVMGAGQTAFRPDLKTRKPLYVDVSAWHLVAVFERYVTGGGDLVTITEALPEPSAAPRYGADRRVTEFMLEVG